MKTMLVNPASAHRCCEFCDNDYGHSPNRKAKRRLARTIKRRERQSWKKEELRG